MLGEIVLFFMNKICSLRIESDYWLIRELADFCSLLVLLVFLLKEKNEFEEKQENHKEQRSSIHQTQGTQATQSSNQPIIRLNSQ